MKKLIVAIGALMLGCTAYADDHATAPTPALDISMMLENFSGPFVTHDFAVHLAQLVVEEKYPKNILVASGVGDVLEKDGIWWVTLIIDVPSGSPFASMVKKPYSTHLTIHIRKTNAEIVSIS
jgi:hypothetical protein